MIESRAAHRSELLLAAVLVVCFAGWVPYEATRHGRVPLVPFLFAALMLAITLMASRAHARFDADGVRGVPGARDVLAWEEISGWQIARPGVVALFPRPASDAAPTLALRPRHTSRTMRLRMFFQPLSRANALTLPIDPACVDELTALLTQRLGAPQPLL